jgi:hypothetical protein
MPPQTGEQSGGDEVLPPPTTPTHGRKEILYEGHYYDVTHWIRRHPGGNIIQFYTECGEDATLAVQQFHQRSMGKVAGIMRGLKKTKPSPTNSK